jgi:hypothetical protein
MKKKDVANALHKSAVPYVAKIDCVCLNLRDFMLEKNKKNVTTHNNLKWWLNSGWRR